MSVLAEAERLAMADAPLEAWHLLESRNLLADPTAKPLVDRLTWHLSHLASRDAYRAFYAADVPERPFLPFDCIPILDRMMMRAALLRSRLVECGVRTVLELGCFDGFLLLHLALTEGMSGVGVDLNGNAIREANRRAHTLSLPCEFVETFIEDFTSNPDRMVNTAWGHRVAPYDAVILFEVLEHVRDVDAVLAIADAHVAPGGNVYVSMPIDVPPHQHDRERKEHVRHFTEAQVRWLLASNGRTPTWYQQYRVPDGLAHMGSYRPAVA